MFELEKEKERKKSRALWVWDDSIEKNREEIERLAKFCLAESVNDIFYTSRGLSEKRWSGISTLISCLSKKGVKVHALFGESSWALREYHSDAISLIKQISLYNASFEEDCRFSGIHDDSEFYTLSLWALSPLAMAEEYLMLLQKIRELIGSSMQMGAAVPFWFADSRICLEHEPRMRTLGEKVMEKLDYVAIMSYRDSACGPNGSISISEPFINLGNELGKRVYVGQETQPGLFPPFLTLYGKSARQIRKEFEKIDSRFEKEPSYAGIAIHHYRSYLEAIEPNQLNEPGQPRTKRPHTKHFDNQKKRSGFALDPDSEKKHSS